MSKVVVCRVVLLTLVLVAVLGAQRICFHRSDLLQGRGEVLRRQRNLPYFWARTWYALGLRVELHRLCAHRDLRTLIVMRAMAFCATVVLLVTAVVTAVLGRHTICCTLARRWLAEPVTMDGFGCSHEPTIDVCSLVGW